MINSYRRLFGTLIFTTIILHSKEVSYDKWHLDEDMGIILSIDANILNIEISNSGDRPRNISSSILDRDYLLANSLTVGFADIGSARLQKEEFSFSGDGIIGVNSRIFKIVPIIINPNETKEVRIDLTTALNNVSNDRLKQYLSRDGSQLNIYLTIALNDIGLKSRSSIRYELPLMKIDHPSSSESFSISEFNAE